MRAHRNISWGSACTVEESKYDNDNGRSEFVCDGFHLLLLTEVAVNPVLG